MKKRGIAFLSLLFRWVFAMGVVLLPFAVQAQTICGVETETALLAGQSVPAGFVTASNDGQNLRVTYHAAGDWVITQTHLHVATDPQALPQTRKGNAIPGRFDYSGAYENGVTEAAFTIDLTQWPAGTQLYIAAHSVVVSAAGEETAWVRGFDFPGDDWAMYFTHTVQSCEPTPVDPGVIEFAQPAISVMEDAGSVTIQLVRTGGSDGAVAVTLETGGVSAEAGFDYDPVYTTVVFEDGESEKQIELYILDDSLFEDDESFGLYIVDIVGAQPGSQLELICTIIDDDGNSIPR